MKLKCLTILVTLVFASNAFALLSQEVKVPLVQHPVPTEGLYIHYDMTGTSPQKVVCIFSNFYKGHYNYSKNRGLADGFYFGNGDDAQQVIFTSKGETLETQGLDSLNQFNTDTKGMIVVYGENGTSPNAAVTCFYQTDN